MELEYSEDLAATLTSEMAALLQFCQATGGNPLALALEALQDMGEFQNLITQVSELTN